MTSGYDDWRDKAVETDGPPDEPTQTQSNLDDIQQEPADPRHYYSDDLERELNEALADADAALEQKRSSHTALAPHHDDTA